jgi:ESS family glutamate:Na+ symporter
MSDSIDSLAWHLAVTGVAVMIGVGLRSLIPMKGFPLFPLCMIGGVLLEIGAKFVKKDLLLDRGQMERISGASLDYLVVAAVATIQIRVVAANWLPLVILVVAGTAWSCAMVLCVAPRIFRTAWFERAIAEFGQAMGVTATGLLLLRTVDPENRTPAAMSFGYKQLLHEPFMGGGIWTALAFTLVYKIGWTNTWLICLAMLAVWGVVAFVLWRRNRSILDKKPTDVSK